MRGPSSPAVRRVAAAVAVAVCAWIGAGGAARADSSSDPNSAVAAAKQQLAQAQAKANQLRTQATLDAQQLAADQAQIQALQQRIAALATQITNDQANVTALQAEIATDRANLSAFIRASYETGGSGSMLEYVFSAADIPTVMQRAAEVSHITDAGQSLVDKINNDEQQAQQALAAAQSAQQQTQAAQAQMQTEEVIISNETMQAQLDAASAETAVAQVNGQLNQAVAEARAYDEAASLLAEARADGQIFQPIPGPLFTEDSDLTVPSQLDATTIDNFLAGSALAGLGPSYIKAEQTYHVSARYLVAHSIEESAWGTSAIAQDKHNLYGYGADDANPYGDAMSFPSFDACIQFVAKTVSANYLTPGGSFYHGPTLHGMNVDYASDPYWAEKIASIARTIPTPPGAQQSGGGTWPTPTPTPSPTPTP